jgi:hypothetical protein
MVDLASIEQWATIIGAIATAAVVFFLWKAVKQMDENVKFSRIQVIHRFRPWVGPSNSIQFMRTNNGKEQFAIKLKNYGELPASNVKAMFAMKNEELTRDVLKNPNSLETFNLGPLLPNMEKSYWFFIDSDLMRKAKDNDDSTQIFIALYFAYEFPGGKSGYGMLSRYDPSTNNFIHNDMWVD